MKESGMSSANIRLIDEYHEGYKEHPSCRLRAAGFYFLYT